MFYERGGFRASFADRGRFQSLWCNPRPLFCACGMSGYFVWNMRFFCVDQRVNWADLGTISGNGTRIEGVSGGDFFLLDELADSADVAD